LLCPLVTVPPLLLLWCTGLLAVTGVELDAAASRAGALEPLDVPDPLELTGVPDPPPGLNSVSTADGDRSAPPVAEEDLRAGSV
jgi:hypothetical protein